MKKLLYLAIIIIVLPLQAKESYYYYHNNRVPLSICDDSVVVYSISSDKSVQDFYSASVVSLQSCISDTSYTSKEYIILGDKKRTVKMSNIFYVQLFDSEMDVAKLETIANKTSTIILGQVPYMPDWYKLAIHKSVIDNSLEMSNYFYETGLFKDVDPGFVFNFTPSCVSDGHFSSQWALPAIKACGTWKITSGSSDIKIAVVDKGIDQYHSEFATVQFVDSYDCYKDDSITYREPYGPHGTQVCGVISANHNSGEMAGMAPQCKIMPINHPLYAIAYSSQQLASGINRAVLHGADVINCSWGDHGGQGFWMHSALLEAAIQNAIENGRNGKGSVVVFIAGNENISQLDYPAYVFSDIITVGAIDSTYRKAPFSSYGSNLDIVAPGESIYTTDTANHYICQLGTSIATPHVSALAGLMLSVNPNLTQKEIGDIIGSTAQKVGGYTYTNQSGHPNGTWNDSVGYGLVDAYASVIAAAGGYIQGPDYVCDTAKYYLIHPSETGETVKWSIYNNGMGAFPSFSILGSDSQDTVLVLCTNPTPMSREEIDRGMGKGLSVKIKQGADSVIYQKEFRWPQGSIPTVSASSSGVWYSGVSRTFTITNCTDVPDSALVWKVVNTIEYTNGHTPSTTTTYYRGRSLTYSTQVPRNAICQVTITATNTFKECGEKSTTLSYYIVRKGILLANVTEDILNVAITLNDEENVRDESSLLSAQSNYTLELWNSIYGCMRIQSAVNTHEQMNIQNLPQGVYVLLLKENGNTIAETKVIIN